MVFIGYRFKIDKKGRFNERLAFYIKKRNLRFEPLGKMLGVNKCTISRWCSGVQRPKPDKLKLLCEILKIKETRLK